MRVVVVVDAFVGVGGGACVAVVGGWALVISVWSEGGE